MSGYEWSVGEEKCITPWHYFLLMLRVSQISSIYVLSETSQIAQNSFQNLHVPPLPSSDQVLRLYCGCPVKAEGECGDNNFESECDKIAETPLSGNFKTRKLINLKILEFRNYKHIFE